MGETVYEAGDVVPEDICARPNDREDIQFAVPVEVFSGYGSAKHVYPMERVESTAKLFTVEQIDRESLVTDDVRLYTIPRDELR